MTTLSLTAAVLARLVGNFSDAILFTLFALAFIRVLLGSSQPRQ